MSEENPASKGIEIRHCLSNHPFGFASFQECGYNFMGQQHILHHLFWASTPAMGLIPILRTVIVENERTIKVVPWNDLCGLYGDINVKRASYFDLRSGLMEPSLKRVLEASVLKTRWSREISTFWLWLYILWSIWTGLSVTMSTLNLFVTIMYIFWKS